MVAIFFIPLTISKRINAKPLFKKELLSVCLTFMPIKTLFLKKRNARSTSTQPAQYRDL